MLFAVALVRANEPFLVAAILPVAPAVLASIHSRCLSDGSRRYPHPRDTEDWMCITSYNLDELIAAAG